MKLILRIVPVAVAILGLMWFYSEPGYGSLITVLVGILAFLCSIWMGREAAVTGGEAQDGNRSRMLAKVRYTWIEGVLEQSLYKRVRMEPGLQEAPDAVDDPWTLTLHGPDHTSRSLSPGTRISSVYDELNGALLILGAPGSGKTTLLLELACDLLDRAEQGHIDLIPVVFNLSSWAVRQGSLADWLVDELNGRYHVPGKLCRAWVDGGRILPLLDGLDEVAPECRTACVDAVNAFRREHPAPVVVCSRTEEYESLFEKLRLQGAVVVQPLSRHQVTACLEQAGAPMEGIRTAYENDPLLQELLQTPLMLNVAMMAYHGQTVEIRATDALEERRVQLFESYVDAMFTRRYVPGNYAGEDTVHRLSWLARTMLRHCQSIFCLEKMQPDWLPAGVQRQMMYLIGSIMPGLYMGLFGALFVGLYFGLTAGLYFGVYFGLLGGLFVGLFGRLNVRNTQPAEKRQRSRLLLSIAFVVLYFGLFGGLYFGVYFGLQSGVYFGLIFGLYGGLYFEFVGRIYRDKFADRSYPNEGIHQSALRSLYFGLYMGLFGVVFFGLYGVLHFGLYGLVFGGLYGGLFGGLFGVLSKGGGAYVRHIMLRSMMWVNGYTPMNYAGFLDYAADRLFLYKVGGGYIFIHRSLLEYFADLEPAHPR